MQELEPPSSQIISSQDHAHAGGDIVGHDKIDLQKIENVEKQEFKQDIKIEVDKAIFVSQQKKSRVDVLIERLQHEIRNDVICKQKMDDILAHYKNIVSALAGTTSRHLAAHDDAPLCEGDFLSNLQLDIPASILYGRQDVLGLDVGFGEVTHPVNPSPKRK